MIFGYMLFMDFEIEFYKNYNFFVFEEIIGLIDL